MKTLFALFLLCSIVNGKKSCISTCSNTAFPHCGAWLHEDNSKDIQGIYFLNKDTINLTCSVNSLPTPAQITWLHKPDGHSTWHNLRCSSSRTVRDCKFNNAGEHRVSSICTLKLNELKQSGLYHCSGRVAKAEINSQETKIDVYGISNVSLVEYQLIYGKTGHVFVEVCGNPKPRVLWIHESTGTGIQSGHTVDTFSVLPLQIVVAQEPPANERSYCYMSKFYISKVHGLDDGDIAVIASNSVEDKRKEFRFKVEKVPYWVRYPNKGENGLKTELTVVVFSLLLVFRNLF